MAENPRIEELRRRVQADPASIVFAALAEEFRRVGRYDEAVETCRTGLQRHPAYLSARVTLGRALIETGDFDGAREELETVLRSAPENLAAIRGLAQIEERLGHSAEMDPHIAAQMQSMHADALRAAALKPPPPPPVDIEPIPVLRPAPDAVRAPDQDAGLLLHPAAGASRDAGTDRSFDASAELSLAPQADVAEPESPRQQERELSLDGLASAPGVEFSLHKANSDQTFSLDPATAPDPSVAESEPAAAAGGAQADVFAGYAPATGREPAADFTIDLSTAFSTEPASAPQPDSRFDLSLDAAAGAVIAPPDPEPRVPQVTAREADAPPPSAPPDHPAPPPTRSAEAPAEPASEAEEDDSERAESGPYAAEGPDPAMLATLARLERFLGAIQSLRQ